ncbi:hypothetical protein [Streptomyces canus]|uniref:hypothetical protein n=1 Tax=Streptomyces canus TaxID=58343 RepID=UPI002DDAED3B|nr:hypothetical protein [Streptomyces canus]WSD83361.1 hypothetical protein OG925_03200 [Streptomyces canus]
MSRRELGPYPGLSYAHMVSKDVHSSHVVRRFALYPIDIERPEKGRRVVALECGSCQKPLKFKVLSVAATRTRRWVWLVLGLAGAVAALGFGVAIFEVGGQVVEEGASNPVGPLALGFLAGFLSGTFGLSYWRYEDGVRGPGSPLMSLGGHALRWPPS